MSKTLADAQVDMLELLGSLGPNDDPYAAIAEYLRSQVFPTVPYSAHCQLYLLAAALGVAAVLILASLFIRWRKGVFWVVRMQQQPRVVRPHWSISWSLIAAVMLVLFEVFIAYARGFFARSANERFGFWFLVVWGVAWWGGQTAAWSLGVSYLLHQHATGYEVGFLAGLSNVFGLAVPVAYFGALLPLVIIGGSAYSGMIGAYRDADELLAQASVRWTPGQRVNILSLAPAMPILETLVDNYEVFQRYFRIVFILYCATAVALVICLVTIASIYLTSLRRVLTSTRRDLSTSQGSSSFVRRPQQEQVSRTLQSHLVTIVAFTFLGTVFASVAIVAALSPRALASSPLRAQIPILLPLYAFAVFGLPCAVILVLRARDANAAEEASANSGGSGSQHRSRTFGAGPFGGGSASKSGRGRQSAGTAPESGVDVISAGQQFSIQLAHLDSNEPFPPPAFSSVAGSGDGDGVAAPDTLDGVKVAVDVDVVVDEDDDLDEKFELRRTVTRGGSV